MIVERLKDTELERRLLGAVLVQPSELADALDTLREDDFYADKHRAIWRAMRAVHAAGELLDTNLLRAELVARSEHKRAGGDEYLIELPGYLESSGNIGRIARRLRSIAAVRSYQDKMVALLAESQEPIEDLEAFADRVERSFVSGSERLVKRRPELMSEVLKSTYADIERRVYSQQSPGHRTQLYDYDQLVGGLVPGEVTVVAARPGMGKSALAQAWSLGVASSSKPVLVVSLEMSKYMNASRVLAAVGEVDGRRIRTVQLNRHELGRMRAAAESLAGSKLYIEDDPGMSMLDIRRAARFVAGREREDLGLVVIDYAQLIKPFERSASRERDVAEISAATTALAKEMRCPVVLLAQLNRDAEKRPNKRPILSDLRESGAIEQDANVVVFIYRDEVVNANTEQRGIAELIVAKNRMGPTGMVEVRYVKEWMRFQNFDGRGDPGPQQQEMDHG